MKNITNICKSIVVVMACFLLACGSTITKTKPNADNRLKAESKFDPLGGLQDKAVITGKHASRISVAASHEDDSLASDNPEPGQSPISDTLSELFRVQIYISKFVDEAQQYASSIKELFPEGVFVEYQPPYYKVRVGEFHKAVDGETFLEHVKQLGFENAWLVRVIK
jgi:hypothetical protein